MKGQRLTGWRRIVLPGKIVDKPVVVAGRVEVRPVLPIALFIAFALFVGVLPACAEDDGGGGGGKEADCISSGGTVETTLCCFTSHDFPNLCLVGACGCSLENSVPTETCRCASGSCFDGTRCVPK